MFLLDQDPVIRNALETDFYKYPMGQFQLHKAPKVSVKWGFINRTKVRLAERISIRNLREELEHAFSLGHGSSALHYLRGTNEYSERMFSEDFLQSLKKAPKVEWSVEEEDGQFRIEADGLWADSTRCEIPVLKCVNTLHTDYLYRQLTRAERREVQREGRRRLLEKIHTLKKYTDITILEFGNRRAASPLWHEEVVATLKEHLSQEQFLGTSNTYLAEKYDLTPGGTNAHESYMVSAALYEDLVQASTKFINGWWAEFGHGLSIFLPDTYTTQFFLDKVLTPDMARDWKGSRQDSGDPIEYGEKWIAYYKHHGIDSRTKLIVFSDGLTLSEIIRIANHFRGRIRVSFGWGTNLTNDLPFFLALSIVMKPIEARFERDGILHQVQLSKLSDNLAKATGHPEAIERDKRRAGVHILFNEEPTY